MDEKYKKYLELLEQEYKREEIFSLMELDTSQVEKNGYDAWIIRNCINPNSDVGKKGMVHIAVPFKATRHGLREECYKAFLLDYSLGRIREGFI